MIFEDPTRKRWRIAVASFTSLAMLGLVLLSLSAAALMTSPQLPGLEAATISVTRTPIKGDIGASDAVSQLRTPDQWKHVGSEHDRSFYSVPTSTASLDPIAEEGKALRTAFLLQQDANSLRNFQENSGNIDVVFPDWYFLSRNDCSLDQRISPGAKDVLAKSGTTVIARVTDGEGSVNYGQQVSAIMNDSKLRACVSGTLAADAQRNGAKGILVDVETLSQADDDAYLRFLLEMRRALHAKGMSLVVAVPSGSRAYHAEIIAKISDAVLVIMHGEHYGSSKAGPLASQGWFNETLDHFSEVIPKDKLLVGIGSYGMDWNVAVSTSTGVGLAYSEVMSSAEEIGVLPEMASKSKNMAFAYLDGKGDRHEVWFVDAPVVWNEWKAINEKGALGVAVWRLGTEDPNIWTFLGQKQPSAKPLSRSPSLYGVYSSSGAEVYRVQSTPAEGELSFVQDDGGAIVKAGYLRLPTGYIMGRIGAAPPAKTLALAFNNGPDPEWTPRLIEVLKKHDVPATFFVMGNQAEKYPNVLQQIAREGFVIGNRGYRNADLKTLPKDQIRNDVNMTQRLIEDASNRHSLLFEANMPTQPEDAVPLMSLAEMGYVIVSPNVNPVDWEAKDADALAKEIESRLNKPESHIINLHDGGGDRSVLVAALDKAIPSLKEKGYKFVGLDQIMGVAENKLLPGYSGNEAVLVTATNIVNKGKGLFWPTIFWIFLLTTSFSILRILFMSIFVLRSTRRRKKLFRMPGNITVSVLIPAYNEEKTIGKTLESLQASAHKRFEALVIDDGSTDRTGDVVREYAKKDKRIRLVTKTNGGKSTALNLGMREAKNDIVVTIDADTILLPQAIDELIKPFADPSVDAVCGNVEVGNVHNALTGFQALEYITAQNFDRRAFEEVNAISVVPGATGAWKRKKVLEIGGYESDTLTEDADLTIRMLAQGGKIVYAPEARSLTEAPDKMRDLAKQRFRWSFGTFQCLGKHADRFFKGPVGWIALPNIFIFQIIFPLLAPIGDIVFLLTILKGDFGVIFYSYVFFTLMDVIGSVFAFVLEKKPKRLMLFVLIQRFFYRQFLYVTIIRAILAMLQGRRYGWNKLQRTGSVTTAVPVAGKSGN